jgi:Flp pilus assembly protein TadB
MPAPTSPSWTRGSRARGRADDIHPDMRVSDAERAAVADRLAKHYADGRLDQAEFDRRMDQAMRATTQADLSGLFVDLPGTEPVQAPPRRRDRRPTIRFLFLVLVVVLAAALGQALVRPYTFWLVIALFVVLWLRHGPRQRRRL